ncbi:MAG: ATP-binding cassette domain-containing protein, partial [Bacilli bacterium]
MGNEPFIKLVDVSKIYTSKGTSSIGLQNISAEFSLGEFVAITGESGSGKSTLLNVIACQD